MNIGSPMRVYEADPNTAPAIYEQEEMEITPLEQEWEDRDREAQETELEEVPC